MFTLITSKSYGHAIFNEKQKQLAVFLIKRHRASEKVIVQALSDV